MKITPIALLASVLLLPAATFGQSSQSAPSQTAPHAVRSVSADDLARRIHAGEAPFILDVRSVSEFQEGHIPGAVNVPHDQLADRLDELPGPEAEIVVHCHSGRRAGVAEALLTEAGFTRLFDLEGHWKGWVARGLPTR